MKKNDIPPTRGRDSMGLLTPRDVPRAAPRYIPDCVVIDALQSITPTTTKDQTDH